MIYLLIARQNERHIYLISAASKLTAEALIAQGWTARLFASLAEAEAAQ